MSTAQVDREEEKAVRQAARLLYICDFPPSNAAGGSILLSRLLESYPPERLIVLTGSHASKISTAAGRLRCTQITFPTSKGWGRWGLGRIRNLLDWLRLPFLTFLSIHLIRRHSIEAMVTLFHGRFYLAACAAARLTRTPYVAFVHDDYVSDKRSMWRRALYLATRTAARHAAHIYAVSSGMQEKLRFEFAVDSEVQLPATKAHFKEFPETNRKLKNESLLIVYAGSITNAVEDSVRLLVEIITNGMLKDYGIPSAKFHLFTSLKPDQVRAWGWDHPDVQLSPWISQAEIPKALSQADILFLPFSFCDDVRNLIETAFPSKTADYLASGRPVLVFGPKYSSLVRYASEEGFAEVVDEFNPVALAEGIRKIALSPVQQNRLAARSLEIFSRNHDIERQQNQFQLLVRKIVREGRENVS